MKDYLRPALELSVAGVSSYYAAQRWAKSSNPFATVALITIAKLAFEIIDKQYGSEYFDHFRNWKNPSDWGNLLFYCHTCVPLFGLQSLGQRLSWNIPSLGKTLAIFTLFHWSSRVITSGGAILVGKIEHWLTFGVSYKKPL